MPLPISPDVITGLQQSAANHLTAVEFYALLAAHVARLGYASLAARFAEEADDERKHLAIAVERLEFFWRTPLLDHEPGNLPDSRDDVELLLRSALAMEARVAESERAAITAARAAGDEGTAVALTPLLVGTEASLLAIESDLVTIGQIGLDNWLANHAAR